MDGLLLAITSFADMTPDRASAVGRAFDAHPLLRPVKVGGDPARIRVDDSMERTLHEHGLPVEWLTVRRDGRWPDFEGGRITLLPGRGSWSGSQEDGRWEYSLDGHEVSQHWLSGTLAAPGALAEAAGLLEDLVVAMDAAYGYVTPFARLPRGPIVNQLPGVFWLNYFGPAFLAGRPGLRDVRGARELATGGVLVRTADGPSPVADGSSDPRAELRELFGPDAFEFRRPQPALPTAEDHVAVSPGTQEMPWEPWLRDKRVEDLAKRHAAARRRLATALERRPVAVVVPDDALEWSTSFDLPDWDRFAAHLARALRGDLSGAIGKALVTVVATAPLDEQDHVVLETRMGAVRLCWFVGDPDTVDVHVHGSAQVAELCQSWFA
ncbi:hypothetical protein [Cellulomonas sp.]|uniref:hypothetical protein n=1 Tax=Cellulomonas sp. TaxID=40001 RepID=UPI001B12B36F|nr:hypothetical protein [Cellulomonas sp.]MBO9554895.1 hypothetical protein [Cellulomonas sp.]